MFITRDFWLYLAAALLIVAGITAKDLFVKGANAEEATAIGADVTQIAAAQSAFRLPQHVVLVRTVDGRVTDVPLSERHAWLRFASEFGTPDVKIDVVSAAAVVGETAGPVVWIGNMRTSLKQVALGRAANDADAILVYEVADGDSGAAIVAAYLLPGEGDAAPSDLVGFAVNRPAAAADGGVGSSESAVSDQIEPVAAHLGIQLAAVQRDRR